MRFVAAGCFSLAVLAAGPDRLVSQPGLGPLAAHFDSLATAELAKPQLDHERVQRLALIVYALAGGADPGQVTMSIAGRPMSFQVVGIETDRDGIMPLRAVHAVGWHDLDADTTIALSAMSALTTEAESDLRVVLLRGTIVDSGEAYRPALTFSVSMSDTLCMYYRLLHALYTPSARCNVGHATMTFATLSDGGTFIASPEFTFGLARVAFPKR
jgi:hypothetical protein